MAEKKKRPSYKELSKAEAIRQFKRDQNEYKKSFRDTPARERRVRAEEKLSKKGVDYKAFELLGEKHHEALKSRDPDIAEMAKASAAWYDSIPDEPSALALKEAHGVTDREIRRLRFEAEDPEFNPDAPDAATDAAAPAGPADIVRGKDSREFRNKPDIPVLPLVPDKPAVPDEKPPVPPDAADPDDMPDIDPKTGKPWTRKGLREHIEVIKKESDDQAKRDVRAAKEKQADDNAGKPQWTKYEEAKAKYEARHGRPPPPNWISSASQTELADQATIPQAMKDLGIYSTYSGDTDPKTGLTKPEVWDKLFKGSGKQDEGWTEVDGGRVSADGRFQMPFGDKGRWGDVTAPMSLTLDRHFGGKDWLTKKAWSSATPDEQASMIRADAGIPTPQVWVTPTDTAAEVGADIAALDGTSVDQMTRLPVPAGARMVSGQSGSGFTTTKLPAAPPAQGAGSQAAGKLPAVDPETETIIDNAVKATRTKS
jgi:hypothetical protein